CAAALYRTWTWLAQPGRDGRRFIPGRPVADPHVPHCAARRLMDAPEGRLLSRRALRNAARRDRALRPHPPAGTDQPGKRRARGILEVVIGAPAVALTAKAPFVRLRTDEAQVAH